MVFPEFIFPHGYLSLIMDEVDNEIWDMITTYVRDRTDQAIPWPLTQLYHTRPFSGSSLIHDILNGHDVRSYEIFRIVKPQFYQLRNMLVQRGLLKYSLFIGISEQLVILLLAIYGSLLKSGWIVAG